jgi:hypothetical protein
MYEIANGYLLGVSNPEFSLQPHRPAYCNSKPQHLYPQFTNPNHNTRICATDNYKSTSTYAHKHTTTYTNTPPETGLTLTYTEKSLVL